MNWLSFGFLAALLLSVPGWTCSLYSVAGSSGVIVGKNRDSADGLIQSVELVRGGRYSYLALFGVDQEGIDPRGTLVRAGVNEQGFTVLLAAASSVPEELRRVDRKSHGLPRLIHDLLQNFTTVEDAIQRQAKWGGPQFLLLADRKETALVEIGLEGKVSIQRTSNGVLAHTNHYLASEFTWLNQQKVDGSVRRLHRLEGLLNRPSLDFDDFIGVSHEMWRAEGRVRTLSSWILEHPTFGESRIRWEIQNPDGSVTVRQESLHEAFRYLSHK